MSVFQTDFQLRTFLYILYTGFFACAVHGIFSPLFSRKHFFLTLIFDTFISVLTAYFLFLSIFHSGSDSLRIYMPIAFLLGGLVYHFTYGKLYKKCLNLLCLKRKSAADDE